VPAEPRYDRIGSGYAGPRQPDPRIAEQVRAALGDARRVVNVGAGAGSYEPADRFVVAVEPSATMRAQRPVGSAPCVAGVAGALPFPDGAFDACLAVLTIHHWPDQAAGLDELHRVASRHVVLTFDPAAHLDFWLVRDYLPEVADLPASYPLAPAEVATRLGGGQVHPVPVPADCRDGFLLAYWRRPEAYLEPAVRASISALALLPDDLVALRMARLEADLADGTWRERHGHLLERDTYDDGYHLVIAGDR
jgi:SAM-dependent methyltransferase